MTLKPKICHQTKNKLKKINLNF